MLRGQPKLAGSTISGTSANRDRSGGSGVGSTAGVAVGTDVAVGAGVGVGASLFVYQQWLIRDRKRGACFQAFLNNNLFGLAVFAGLVAHYRFT